MEGRYGRTTQITTRYNRSVIKTLIWDKQKTKAPRNATGFHTVSKITKIEIRKVSNIQTILRVTTVI